MINPSFKEQCENVITLSFFSVVIYYNLWVLFIGLVDNFLNNKIVWITLNQLSFILF